MSYWDTSALGKLYIPEPDSTAFARKAVEENEIVTSRIGFYEIRRLAFRKESEGLIRPGGAEAVLTHVVEDIDSGQLRIVELGAQVEAASLDILVACHRRNPSMPIRTLDGIHLASAKVDPQTELVATDRRIREAGKLLGFTLFPV